MSDDKLTDEELDGLRRLDAPLKHEVVVSSAVQDLARRAVRELTALRGEIRESRAHLFNIAVAVGIENPRSGVGGQDIVSAAIDVAANRHWLLTEHVPTIVAERDGLKADRDRLSAECERLRAEVERMRPVVEAAGPMRNNHEGCVLSDPCGACFRCDFDRAVDAYRAAQPDPASPPASCRGCAHFWHPADATPVNPWAPPMCRKANRPVNGRPDWCPGFEPASPPSTEGGRS